MYFMEGLLLGFTTGLSCMIYCVPIFIGLAARDINNVKGFKNLIWFITGRFISYILTGILFSSVGLLFNDILFLKPLSKIITGMILIYWGVKAFIESDTEKQKCSIKKHSSLFPFAAGILTGLTPCPPFIAGISRVISIGNVLSGVIYFLGFFIATTTFLFPGLFVNIIRYKKELKIITSYASIIFGILFLVYLIFPSF